MLPMRLQVWRLLTIAMLIAIGGAGLGTSPQVLAQEGTAESPVPAAAPAPGGEESLAEIEARLAERYARLEKLVERLAELSRSTQPRRATLLRQLITQSRDRDVAGQFEKVVAALEQESFSSAIDASRNLTGSASVPYSRARKTREVASTIANGAVRSTAQLRSRLTNQARGTRTATRITRGASPAKQSSSFASSPERIHRRIGSAVEASRGAPCRRPETSIPSG